MVVLGALSIFLIFDIFTNRISMFFRYSTILYMMFMFLVLITNIPDSYAIFGFIFLALLVGYVIAFSIVLVTGRDILRIAQR